MQYFFLNRSSIKNHKNLFEKHQFFKLSGDFTLEAILAFQVETDINLFIYLVLLLQFQFS